MTTEEIIEYLNKEEIGTNLYFRKPNDRRSDLPSPWNKVDYLFNDEEIMDYGIDSISDLRKAYNKVKWRVRYALKKVSQTHKITDIDFDSNCRIYTAKLSDGETTNITNEVIDAFVKKIDEHERDWIRARSIDDIPSSEK